MGISASVTNNQITATVGETQIDVAVSGGVGPTGSSGTIAVTAPITNAGTTTAANIGLSVSTGLAVSGGSLVVSYGTSAGTACQGNDARLSDARTPLAHAHVAADITDFTSAVIAAAPPTTDASLLTSGELPDARLSSNIARTSDVSSAVAALVASAPATLDTLNELAAALGNDASFSTTVTNALAAKAPIASPTFTGTVSGVTKSMVGLGNVDNTSDADKPISTAVQAALNNKASVEVFDDLSTVVFNHAHGNITNAGAIGSTSGQIVVTTTSGVLTTAASLAWSLIASTPTTLSGYGITDAVASNDSRLTDSRVPTAHKSSHATGGSDALSPADIGAAAVSHTHSASDIASGTFDIARLPVGTSSTTVAAGNDARFTDARTPLAHVHSGADITSGTVAYARMADPAVTSPSQITASQNDYSGFARGINRFTTNAARDLTGMVAGADGEVRVLCNVGTTAANTLVIKDESASSTAANRFSVPWNGDCVIPAEGSVVCFYDNTSQRWRIV